jgi:hypothetical protein
MALISFSCKQKNHNSLIEIKKLDYPSASSVEYIKGRLFIIGDDANDLLVLDTNFNIKDSIHFYNYPEKRIPKDIKPDLESIAFYRDNEGPEIFLFGSGSLSPYRNSGWRYNLETKIKDSISLDSLYTAIKHEGINEINIEGACFIPGFLVLANRGNKAYPKNHLIFTKQKFWERKNDDDFNIALIGYQQDSSSFSGVSGITYLAKNDWLILSVSTEDTRNSFDDGAIGKSYLWIVKDISSKKRWRAINPDMIIDLESIDKCFSGQKIESACVIAETKDFIQLVLVSDDDKGSSTVIKMNLEKD